MTAFTQDRVRNYCAAEQLCPDARTAELAVFSQYLSDGQGKRALELGSGNGTLTNHLCDMGWTVDTVDIAFDRPRGAQHHFAADIAKGLDFLPDDRGYDAVVSLAVLHHVVNSPDRLPVPLARGLAAATRPGGIVILQDVPAPVSLGEEPSNPGDARTAALATAEIFAELVDRHSVPTHNGIYVRMAAVGAQLAEPFAVLDRAYQRCDWCFPDRDTALAYVRSLFSLHTGEDETAALLDRLLTPTAHDVRLPWALDCIVLRRCGTQ